MWQKKCQESFCSKSKGVRNVCSFSPKEEEEEEEGPSFPKPFISFCVSKGIYKVRVSLTGNWNFSSFRSKCA